LDFHEKYYRGYFFVGISKVFQLDLGSESRVVNIYTDPV